MSDFNLSEQEKETLLKMVDADINVEAAVRKEKSIFVIEKVEDGFILVVINGKKKKHVARDYEDLVAKMKKYE